MGYWIYYLIWLVMAYGLQSSWLLLGILLFVLLRPVLPAPGALFRGLRRLRILKTQVAMNRANATARRDLAALYLELRMPRTAMSLLDEAVANKGADAEMLYLLGVARCRAEQFDEAIVALVGAVELDPRVRFGDPYKVAGDALTALGRYDEALDAYERFLEANGSSLDGHHAMARVLAKQGKSDRAREVLLTARTGFWEIPPALRRRQWGAWFRIQFARVWMTREPAPMAATAFAAALIVMMTCAWK